jgi:ferredoxin
MSKCPRFRKCFANRKPTWADPISTSRIAQHQPEARARTDDVPLLHSLAFSQDAKLNQESTNAPRRTRTLVRCAVFVTAIVLLLPSLPWPQAQLVLPAASPFTGVAASIASRSLGLAAWVFLPVLLLAIVRRRWFCRWACPVGLMTECAGRVSPVSPTRCKPVPRLGTWLVLLSLAAAAVGYPLFLWLDPLAIFAGTMGMASGSSNAAVVAAIALASILIASYALPSVWCLKVCPLGATQELLAIPRRWIVRQVDDDNGATSHDELIAGPMSRRTMLTTAAGATCLMAGAPLGLAARSRAEGREQSVLRPPGAVTEWQFGQLCLRCGNCVRSCPSQIITTRWHSDSWSTWLAPEISFDSDYCREDCVACMQSCPSGALRLLSQDAESKPAIGLAHLTLDRCLLAQGSECRTMCIDACPYEAISLHEWTFEDDRRYPIIVAEKCPGCGACQVACTPMNAIEVRPESG